MSVIEAASAGVRDMADGSLRITFEFEPRHAAQAYAMFGTRGRSVAVAALNDGHAANSPEIPDSSNHSNSSNSSIPSNSGELKPKGGELAKLAGIWCNDADFLKWMGVKTTEQARAAILVRCGIHSRSELDHDRVAADVFHQYFREPYRQHLAKVAA